jgi:hypothetical protein
MSTISVEPFWQDVRFAFRNLLKNPGFLTVVVFSLALGIGANSTIFSVIDAALYRPLPYPYPDQLMVIWDTEANRPESRQSPPHRGTERLAESKPRFPGHCANECA